MTQITGVLDGKDIHAVDLVGSSLSARFLTYGAVLQDLRLEGVAHPLVLGFDNAQSYLTHGQYFGATVGRFANRIAGGRFSIDGADHHLDCNDNGINHLHGGMHGISNRIWTIEDVQSHALHLSIIDKQSVTRYPGDCRIDAYVSLEDDGVLRVRYESRTKAPTIANIAHHSYFNLDDSVDILAHEIKIDAEHYLPVDKTLIPTGDLVPVAGSAFDFRQRRAMEHLDGFKAYDHNFCLAPEHYHLRPVAEVFAPLSGVTMAVSTTEPGLQFYAGGGIAPILGGLGGRAYGQYGGLCLETQNWPDAPNQPNFPSALLMPGETLVQETVYQFSCSAKG